VVVGLPVEWQQRRIADNERTFRSINERLADGLRHVNHLPELLEFVCECGSRSCAERVSLSIDEYEDVRRDARSFAVRPGHVFREAEDVVAGNDRFQVVRKVGIAGAVAEAG
jgi:hypothetical protein